MNQYLVNTVAENVRSLSPSPSFWIKGRGSNTRKFLHSPGDPNGYIGNSGGALVFAPIRKEFKFGLG